MTDNLPTTTGSQTLSRAPLLDDKLGALLKSGDTPVVGPITADKLRAFLAVPDQPAMPTEGDIESMLSRLSLATAKAKVSDDEADEMLDLYWRALKDLPLIDLYAAFDTLLKTSKFMPKPAEIHAAAMLTFSRRNHLRGRARHLVWKHEREWVKPLDPADIITPEEAAAITRATAAQFPSQRTPEADA